MKAQARLASALAIGFATLTLSLVPQVAAAKNCEMMGNLKSVNSNQPITITFVNESGMFRHIDWIDYQGNPVNYRSLNSGESYVQETYVGHPWLIANGPGDCVDIFIPKKSRTIKLK